MKSYLAFAFLLCAFSTAIPVQGQERPAIPPGLDRAQPAPPALGAPAPGGSAPGPRDYGENERLRQENELLRRENALLRKKIQLLGERGNAGTKR